MTGRDGITGEARMSASTHPWRLVLAATALATTAIASACASGAAPGQAGVAAAPTSTSLVWSDEFETIDTGNWSFETGGHGWGNQELQHYTDGRNAFIQYDPMAGSRVLVIEARRGAP